MASLPTLVIVSGPPGAGKTTLAHQIARQIGCPAICRDEIKEGMAHSVPEFTPGAGDELTMQTLPTFFSVLELLISAGVTTVAEAAFQDKVWRPRLAPLQGLAQFRVVHCVVDPDVAWQRQLDRRQRDPLRRVHTDPCSSDARSHGPRQAAFQRPVLDAPAIEVDTTDGLRPPIDQIVAFVSDRS